MIGNVQHAQKNNVHVIHCMKLKWLDISEGINGLEDLAVRFQAYARKIDFRSSFFNFSVFDHGYLYIWRFSVYARLKVHLHGFRYPA